jgi:hypothetical protein
LKEPATTIIVGGLGVIEETGLGKHTTCCMIAKLYILKMFELMVMGFYRKKSG